MTEFLAVAHNQNLATFSMILTQSPPQIVIDRMCELGIAQENFLVTQVTPREVPRYLKVADIAISFIKACYSKQSSSPTKIAEYLASGLPVVCNAGVGDVDDAIVGSNAGVIVREFDAVTYDAALSQLEILRKDSSLADRCRHAAELQFDLQKI